MFLLIQRVDQLQTRDADDKAKLDAQIAKLRHTTRASYLRALSERESPVSVADRFFSILRKHKPKATVPASLYGPLRVRCRVGTSPTPNRPPLSSPHSDSSTNEKALRKAQVGYIGVDVFALHSAVRRRRNLDPSTCPWIKNVREARAPLITGDWFAIADDLGLPEGIYGAGPPSLPFGTRASPVALWVAPDGKAYAKGPVPPPDAGAEPASHGPSSKGPVSGGGRSRGLLTEVGEGCWHSSAVELCAASLPPNEPFLHPLEHAYRAFRYVAPLIDIVHTRHS